MEVFAAIGAILIASHILKPAPGLPQPTVPVMLERTREMVVRDHPLKDPAFEGKGWCKNAVTVPRL